MLLREALGESKSRAALGLGVQLLGGLVSGDGNMSLPDSEEPPSLGYRLKPDCPILTMQTSINQKKTCKEWKKPQESD